MAARTLFLAWLAMGLLSASARAEDLQIAKSVSQYFRLVDFTVEQGTIVCRKRNEIGNRATSRSVGHESKREEQLQIDLADDEPVVEYESKSPTLKLTLAFRNGRQVAIRREPLGDSPLARLTFLQNESGGVVLTVTRDGVTRAYEAPDLWQLILAEPDLCRDELAPLLRLVPLNVDPLPFAQQVEQALAGWAYNQTEDELGSWPTLVARLGSSNFSERQAAELALQKLGERMAPLFDRLDPHALDAEQRFRLRRLRELMSTGGIDTPPRVAQRMSGTPEIWLSLMARPDAERRALAARQLAKLLHQELSFDPEADAATRAKQITTIREELRK